MIIGGNGLHTPEEINDLIALLLRVGDVYHVTLDPLAPGNPAPPGEPWRRPDPCVARRACLVDESPISRVDLPHRQHSRGPEATLARIAECVRRGEGRQGRCQISDDAFGPTSPGVPSPELEPLGD